MDNDLGVSARRESVPSFEESLLAVLVIIYFSIESDPDGSVFIRERLVPRAEVDDREAAEAEPRSRVGRYLASRIVWAAMDDLRRHSIDSLGCDPPFIE